MTGEFNPDLLLDQDVDAFDTSYTLIPAGDYEAMVDTGANAVKVSRGARDDGSHWYSAQLSWKLVDPDPELKKELQRDDVYVSQSFFLDVNDSDGKFELETGPNKNIKLGKTRDALGLNEKSSLRELKGRGPALITVKHLQRKNGEMAAEVAMVTPLEVGRS